MRFFSLSFTVKLMETTFKACLLMMWSMIWFYTRGKGSLTIWLLCSVRCFGLGLEGWCLTANVAEMEKIKKLFKCC